MNPGRVALGLVLVTVLALAVVGPAPAAEPGLIRLDVTIGKSQIIDLKDPFTRASVTNPTIADVFAITPNQILINGKATGVTSLVVFYPGKTMFFDLVVQPDMTLLGERLAQIAPRDRIEVHPAQDAIVLRGTVSSENLVAGAAELAAAFAPKGRVINLLTVQHVTSPQVLLQVHVAEATRAAIRELGFSVRALGDTIQGGAFPGNPFVPALGTLGSVVTGPRPAQRAATPDLPFGGGSFFLSSGARDYAGIVRALAERDLLRTLAKPNIITESGKEAKFLSGGEFPFPVAQQFGTVTFEFKEFGVGLVFTPVVNGDTINLKVRPEVSSLDFSQGLVSSGFNIPVIRKNEAVTSINLRDGESFAIAGLVNNEVRQAVAKIPLLGDIPILGALFRSSRFVNNETELLFLVTVKLVDSPPVGGGPDATRLMELRPGERREFTLVPGIPGVGEVIEHPLGQSNLPAEPGRPTR